MMRAISERVHRITEERGGGHDAPLIGLQLELANKKQQPKEIFQADFNDHKNPAHPQAKKRTLRQLDVATRIKIVTLAARRTLTQQEVAERFGVKVQLVRDLMKDISRKKGSSTIRKREAELRKDQQQAAVSSFIAQQITAKQSIQSAKAIRERVSQ